MTAGASGGGELFADLPPSEPIPSFGEGLDGLACRTGGWPTGSRVYAMEVIGKGDDPQVMLTGGEPIWKEKAKRWSFTGEHKAAVRLSEYREATTRAKGCEE